MSTKINKNLEDDTVQGQILNFSFNALKEYAQSRKHIIMVEDEKKKEKEQTEYKSRAERIIASKKQHKHLEATNKQIRSLEIADRIKMLQELATRQD